MQQIWQSKPDLFYDKGGFNNYDRGLTLGIKEKGHFLGGGGIALGVYFHGDNLGIG